MEKGAAGYPSLPLHYGLTNPGISRDLASRLPNFLGLKAREVMSESHLEDQLLDKLQEFLLQLGHGFCFEARQKRILIGDTYGFLRRSGRTPLKGPGPYTAVVTWPSLALSSELVKQSDCRCRIPDSRSHKPLTC